MISLGRWGETMKPVCMTLSHFLCHAATSISRALSLALSFSHSLSSSQPLFVSSSGKCIDSPLFVLSPTHIQLSRGALSSIPPKMKLHDISSHLIQSGRKERGRRVCRRCLKVTRETVEIRCELASFADIEGQISF